MLSDYEKNHLKEGIGPNPIRITKKMSESERNLEILRYIKEAIRNQPVYYGGDIEICDALLDKLRIENECNSEWEKYWAEKNSVNNN